jgi:hypothetical protein
VNAAKVEHGAFNRGFDVVKVCCHGVPFVFMPENFELCGNPYSIGMWEWSVML